MLSVVRPYRHVMFALSMTDEMDLGSHSSLLLSLTMYCCYRELLSGVLRLSHLSGQGKVSR
jgi:hypothetical protein